MVAYRPISASRMRGNSLVHEWLTTIELVARLTTPRIQVPFLPEIAMVSLNTDLHRSPLIECGLSHCGWHPWHTVPPDDTHQHAVTLNTRLGVYECCARTNGIPDSLTRKNKSQSSAYAG